MGLHFKTLEKKPVLLLDGKNAGKLWDAENIAFKCESAIIIGSEQQKSNKMQRLGAGARDTVIKKIQETPRLVYGTQVGKQVYFAWVLLEFNLQFLNQYKSNSKEQLKLIIKKYPNLLVNILTFVQF